MQQKINLVKNYIGIDIGGMSVKGIIINRNGNVLCEKTVETGSEKNGDDLCGRIVGLINEMILADGGLKSSFAGIGIGCPGLIDSKRGLVIFAGNLGLKNYPLAEKISDSVGMAVKLTNDANAAALGEAKFGAGSKYESSVLVTLGTGVGGGVVMDGELFEGGNSAGTEIGHTVIVENGEKCTCGRRGCLEAYSSATALISQTRKAMIENVDSAMWQTYTPETVNGKTAFEYAKTDITAKSVIDNYVKHLACGLTNFANTFRPEAIMLGGGISEQGENLTKPLQEILDREIFAGQSYAPVKVVKAALGNKAGAFGAAALFL